MADAKKPVYVKLNDDGNVDVTLSKPIIIEGAKVTALVMREPTVNDQLIMDASAETPAAKEIALFANLTGQSPADIKKMTLRDFQRLQLGFAFFLD